MLEVIVETVQDAITAAQAGADRLELVSALCDGGLTPSIALVEHVSNYVMIPVRVMLRPHARSFVYDLYDKEVIFKDLERIKATKAEGIVFGALKQDGTIDESLLEEVIQHKGHLKLTFHRAIDESINYQVATDTIFKFPVDTVLTSGGQNSAFEAKEIFSSLAPLYQARGIELLAGKGLDLNNLKEFIQATHVKSIHVGSGAQTKSHVNLNKVEKLARLVNEKT